MKYRRLGKAGVKVSAISIGAWLTYGNVIGYETAQECIRTAIDNGINFIDVADIYAKGKAEEIVGKIIQDYQRSDLVVSTKAYWPMSDNINDQGLSRKHLFESVHKSLKRFNTDYVDIFFCHRFDEETPVEETVRAIEDLIQQGKILYWGTSMWTAANITKAVAISKAINANRPVVEQPKYNMLDRDVVEGELEATVKNNGMGLVVWASLAMAMGLLTGKYDDGIPENSRATTIDSEGIKSQFSDARIEKARGISALAREMGVTPASLALAWAMKHPSMSSVITGATKPSHVEENIKALDVEVTDEIEARIEDILQNKPEGSHR